MASKRSVRRRVAKALRKYVRGNAGPRSMRKSKKAIKTKYTKMGRSGVLGSSTFGPKYKYSGHPFSRGTTDRLRKFNPPKVKGRKVKGGRAVTLRNFTGTIVKKQDGTVQIVGKGKRK